MVPLATTSRLVTMQVTYLKNLAHANLYLRCTRTCNQATQSVCAFADGAGIGKKSRRQIQILDKQKGFFLLRGLHVSAWLVSSSRLATLVVGAARVGSTGKDILA